MRSAGAVDAGLVRFYFTGGIQMRDLIIKNVKDEGYKVKNLNRFYDPDGE